MKRELHARRYDPLAGLKILSSSVYDPANPPVIPIIEFEKFLNQEFSNMSGRSRFSSSSFPYGNAFLSPIPSQEEHYEQPKANYSPQPYLS